MSLLLFVPFFLSVRDSNRKSRWFIRIRRPAKLARQFAEWVTPTNIEYEMQSGEFWSELSTNLARAFRVPFDNQIYSHIIPWPRILVMYCLDKRLMVYRIGGYWAIYRVLSPGEVELVSGKEASTLIDYLKAHVDEAHWGLTEEADQLLASIGTCTT